MSIQGPSALVDGTGGAVATPAGASASSLVPPSSVPTSSVPSTPSTPPVATTSLSPQAELLGKLQSLKEQNPSLFSRTLQQAADQARAQAAKATGATKQALGQAADRLAQVAKSGDLSVFKPTKHHRAHHAPAHTGNGMGSLLDVLLQQVDHVLGPGASSPLAP